jgi:acetamidase/formamidase
MMHELPLERRTLHGHFSRELPPIVTIEPGDTIAFSCPNAGWEYEHGVRFEPYDEELDAGHALVGPVEVRGAKSGATLVVRVRSVSPGSWGVTLAHEPTKIEWRLEDAVGVADRGMRVVLAPFLGVMGMPPDEPGRHSTGPPRRFGGNIDCKELVAGTTLYLPITVDGALLSAGDGHAAQGDGEVSQLAIEAPVERAQLTLSLRDDLPLARPIAWTPGAWLTFGFDEDLDEAAAQAIDGMLELMGREHGLERREALALASVVVDLRVTQMVNGVRGIHALLAHDALR